MSSSRVAIALDEFQQLLTPTQKTELNSLSQGTPTPDDVFQFTKTIEERSWKRKSRIIISRISGFLASVQQYCGVVDTFVSSNPQIGGLVWGSVKLLIVLSSKFAGYFDKLSELIEQVNSYCPRLQHYKEIFNEFQRFRNAVDEFYAIVMVFCSEALKIAQGEGFRHKLKIFWSSFKDEFAPLQQLQQDLSDAKHEIDEEIKLASEQRQHGIQKLQLIELSKNREFRQRQDLETFRSQRGRSQQSQALARIEKREIERLMKEEDRRRLRVYGMICTWDYQLPLRKVLGEHCEGTGTWILSRPEFIKWRSASHGAGLWLRSPSGYGKTFLAAYIYKYLMDLRTKGDDFLVVYYFFTGLRQDSLSPINFMRSILHQILSPEMLSPRLQRTIEKLFLSLLGPREPDISELESLIIDQSGELKVKQIFLIIDGLDEANTSNQRLILCFLYRLYTSNPSSLKILTSAQAEVDLGSPFRNNATITTIYLKGHDMQEDVDIYLKAKGTTYLNDRLRDCSEALISEVKNVLSRKSEGMFLWVVLQLNSICDVFDLDGSDARIRLYMNKLPRTLRDIYIQAVKRIHEVTGDDFEVALRIFQCISGARQPLTLAELEEAIAITPGQKSWAPARIHLTGPDGLSRLSKRTANLVAFNELDDTITLSHHSVKTFVQSWSTIPELSQLFLKPIDADLHLGEICITYLSFADFEKSLTKTVNSRAVGALGQPSNLVPLILQEAVPAATLVNRAWFKQPSVTASVNYSPEAYIRNILGTTQAHTYDSHFKLREYCAKNWYEHLRNNSPHREDLIHSFHQLVVTKTLPFPFRPWKTSDKADALPFWSLFSWAIRGPYLPFLQIWQGIVSEEIVSASWELLWSAEGEKIFLDACVVGNIEKASLLLRNAVPDKGRGRLSRGCLATGLCKASMSGNEALLECLLGVGADTNIRWEQFNLAMPLQFASSGGHIAAVERLLRAGADVNANPAESNGGTALQAAANGGHMAVVERLLQAGADVNANPTGSYGRTALQAAAEGGHMAIVERLLQAGADVNANPAESYGRTALQAAAEGGHMEIVERLLQAGADVNANPAESYGRTVLQAAAEGGHMAIVERLLQAGAEINANPAHLHGRTALQAAAEGGHMAVVERLLQAGADVNADPPIHGKTALRAATERGHMAIVERLLQAGADVNADPSNYREKPPLQAAVEGGHMEIVERLLQAGADVNANPTGSYGRTALQAAAEGGHMAIVERLLQAGADVNADPSEYGRTALQAAAKGGHMAVVERLLQAGADVNADPSEYGRTALQAAAKGGHMAVVERLLQAGADVNADPSEYGRTALQAAAEGGHMAVVERLLQAGAEINANPAESYRRTALQAAAEGGHMAIVERLLQAGADVNANPAESCGRTALQAAANGGHMAVVERLLQAGADVNANPAVSFGRTALQAAAEGGHMEIVERLLQAGAEINANPARFTGRTALQAAAEGGQMAVVERLLQAGADVNANPAGFHGSTALRAAAEGGHMAVVERLVQAGAEGSYSI